MARGMSGGWEEAEARRVERSCRQRRVRENWVLACGMSQCPPVLPILQSYKACLNFDEAWVARCASPSVSANPTLPPLLCAAGVLPDQQCLIFAGKLIEDRARIRPFTLATPTPAPLACAAGKPA